MSNSTHLSETRPLLAIRRYEPLPDLPRIFTSILTGLSVASFATYLLIIRIHYLIANAAVTSDTEHWIERARIDGYDACYNGCNDCRDVDFAYKACRKTARLLVDGIDCDGAKMWNWKADHRYPMECLKSLGAVYMEEALVRKKRQYHDWYWMIILTVLAGIVAGGLVYETWPFFSRLRFRRAPSSPPPYSRNNPAAVRPRRGRQWPFFWRTATVAMLVGGTQGFACWGYSYKANQYFTNRERTLSGVVHGWTSSCYDEQYSCGQTCSSTPDGRGGGSTSCTTDWCWRTVEEYSPKWFVGKASRKVEACGFILMDRVDGDVKWRIGNPYLERDWYVKIAVNTYNLTDETDPKVLCLWDIGNG